MQTQQKLFTNRMLLTLLWPLVVEQALNVLVGMSDTVKVSSVGEAAISGVSLVDMINYLILNIFAALATGGAVITSQFLGAKKPGEASRSAGQLKNNVIARAHHARGNPHPPSPRPPCLKGAGTAKP